jgi:hypothetical protein
MDLSKKLAPLLGLLLLLAVILGAWRSFKGKSAADQSAVRDASRITVRVVSGSEKIPLLKDERLTKVLLDKYGITLEIQKAGSREIAGLANLKTFDVAFPAGQPAADKIARSIGVKRSATAFSTPMVVASWKPIAEMLASNGIVEDKGGAYWIVDMGKLLDMMATGKRWRDLPNNSAFPVGKSVLVSTTDVRTSNSAAQFLALASYLFNKAEVVTTNEQADRVAGKVSPLFLRQGYLETSSSGPFEDYLSIGIGKTPLVWIYEAQFLEQAMQRGVKADMVLLYPKPTLFTKHVMVSLSDQGSRFLEAMADPAVLVIAGEYGYRSEGAGNLDAIRAKARTKGLTLPELVDLVDPPSYDILERMIQAVESAKDAPDSNTATKTTKEKSR